MLAESIVEQVGLGVVVVDRRHQVLCWNSFMARYSGRPADTVVGRNLYEALPSLPATWLQAEVENVWTRGTAGFSSWEQRPHVFFPSIRQDCTFLPLVDATGAVEHVCITVQPVSATALSLRLLEESSQRDGLTGIYNRRFLDGHLEREIARVLRYGGVLSAILFDLDHFKSINDTRGHLAGDDVLRAVADLASRRLRNVDVLGRYGGEEFLILLPSTALDGARYVAQRLCQAMEQHPLDFTASFGVAQWTCQQPDPRQLLGHADEALYRAKQAGRNQVAVYDLAPVTTTLSR